MLTPPYFMGLPPEWHSAMLNSGPGSGPLVQAAAMWQQQASEFGTAAQQLTNEMAVVPWQGGGSIAYRDAHARYLKWLIEQGEEAERQAAVHGEVAGAYVTAVATMPPLGEVIANRTTQQVLQAMNFFGINTIPITLNEADYWRMWLQAATTMELYQAQAALALSNPMRNDFAPPILQGSGEQAGPLVLYTGANEDNQEEKRLVQTPIINEIDDATDLSDLEVDNTVQPIIEEPDDIDDFGIDSVQGINNGADADGDNNAPLQLVRYLDRQPGIDNKLDDYSEPIIEEIDDSAKVPDGSLESTYDSDESIKPAVEDQDPVYEPDNTDLESLDDGPSGDEADDEPAPEPKENPRPAYEQMYPEFDDEDPGYEADGEFEPDAANDDLFADEDLHGDDGEDSSSSSESEVDDDPFRGDDTKPEPQRDEIRPPDSDGGDEDDLFADEDLHGDDGEDISSSSESEVDDDPFRGDDTKPEPQRDEIRPPDSDGGDEDDLFADEDLHGDDGEDISSSSESEVDDDPFRGDDPKPEPQRDEVQLPDSNGDDLGDIELEDDDLVADEDLPGNEDELNDYLDETDFGTDDDPFGNELDEIEPDPIDDGGLPLDNVDRLYNPVQLELIDLDGPPVLPADSLVAITEPITGFAFDGLTQVVQFIDQTLSIIGDVFGFVVDYVGAISGFVVDFISWTLGAVVGSISWIANLIGGIFYFTFTTATAPFMLLAPSISLVASFITEFVLAFTEIGSVYAPMLLGGALIATGPLLSVMPVSGVASVASVADWDHRDDQRRDNAAGAGPEPTDDVAGLVFVGEHHDLAPQPDAGAMGFADSAPKQIATQPRGLITVLSGMFGDGPWVPLLPATWGGVLHTQG
ncbi:PPE domain-containing protein [Mycobacterium decipiens]|uniref:PPE domain-containing protein n=1 Tax=Mycobacterium decipiens TaxID=1430326 RepID=UPI0031016287